MLKFKKNDISTYSQVGRHISKSFSTSKILASPKEYVEIKKNNGVKTIILNDIATRNSLSLQMLKTIKMHIKEDENNKDLRSIVFKSASENIFSAGHNIKELNTKNQKLHKEIFETCSELMLDISQCPVPVIAAVDGLAAAAGCQLVAACDIAICTERSAFATPGANFGIFCSTPGIPLVRNVSKKTAMYMLFTGLSINGKQAYEAGLVSKVVPNDNLEEELKTITDAINYNSRSIMQIGKTFLHEQIELNVSSAYFLGTETMVHTLKMKDAQEGINSFIEKRKPVWSHGYEKH